MAGPRTDSSSTASKVSPLVFRRVSLHLMLKFPSLVTFLGIANLAPNGPDDGGLMVLQGSKEVRNHPVTLSYPSRLTYFCLSLSSSTKSSRSSIIRRERVGLTSTFVFNFFRPFPSPFEPFQPNTLFCFFEFSLTTTLPRCSTGSSMRRVASGTRFAQTQAT